ncbi:MAG: aminotransferase class V-fold PLP-dependent enzyme [Acidobacteria bacterium]|nr:aminotransferase class V-fold PLP-dependent enzyme [Acidobacteriota bacterium]
MPVYLDCAATSPLDPQVLEICTRYLQQDFGNAGSRTHPQGAAARQAVEHARDQVAAVTGCARGDVVFTSGATESNNIALLGLAEEGIRSGKRHLVSTAIEHRAVIEPLEALARRGFALTLVPPSRGGLVEPDTVLDAVRKDTLLVSVMHVNNETGVQQPISRLADRLADTPVYFHTDAAQGFAKELESLRHPGIDLISISAHKICGPKGAGALIVRRRGAVRPPLNPLFFGGGQERGLRPGTLPVALIAALGEAAELWSRDADRRWQCGIAFRQALLDGLAPLAPVVHGDLDLAAPFILNISIPGFDSETVMELWRDLVSVSSGAACSSHLYTCSHVLSAMGVAAGPSAGAIRFSWCHLSEMPDTAAMVRALVKAREPRRAPGSG